jgi:phosphopantothenoylcysteine decarboxylase / phosphopantothenate---cysteine ligase
MLKGKKILITAGPTYEPIDPVRFIGNRSSGKMGYAIAEILAESGVEVYLVSGPTNLTPKNPSIKLFQIETARQMFDCCVDLFKSVDAAICAAAVADYTPEIVSDKKIKKEQSGNNEMLLKLVPAKDILAHLGKIKSPAQVLVGFSLETDNEIENSKSKVDKKNLDFIVLNSLNDAGAGFSTDTNKITIISKEGAVIKFPLKMKSEVATDIVNYLTANYFH